MKITVQRIAEKGIYDGKVWLNFGYKSGLKSAMFVKGAEYEVETTPGQKGGMFLNKASAVVASQVTTTTAAPSMLDTVKKEYPKPMPKREDKVVDWDRKDRSQLVGGRSHDAVELVKASLNSMKPMNEVLELYKEALEGVLKIADEVK